MWFLCGVVCQVYEMWEIFLSSSLQFKQWVCKVTQKETSNWNTICLNKLMKLGKSKEETGSTFLLIKLGRNVDRACRTNISFFSNSFVLVISVPAAYSVMAIVPGMMKLSELLRQRKASVRIHWGLGLGSHSVTRAETGLAVESEESQSPVSCYVRRDQLSPVQCPVSTQSCVNNTVRRAGSGHDMLTRI